MLNTIHYEYSYDYNMGPLYLIAFIMFIFNCFLMYRIATKMGLPGWKGAIPIYGLWVMLDKIDNKGYYVLLAFLPFVGVVFALLAAYKLFKAFGLSGLWIIATVIPLIGVIPYVMLAFSEECQYIEKTIEKTNYYV